MSVLKDILKESKEYYQKAKVKIEKRLAVLPKGSIKKRSIGGREYYYLQYRSGQKVIQEYQGKQMPEGVAEKIKERKALSLELKKVNESLKIIRRSEGRKRD